jgi:hypothetical protein
MVRAARPHCEAATSASIVWETLGTSECRWRPHRLTKRGPIRRSSSLARVPRPFRRVRTPLCPQSGRAPRQVRSRWTHASRRCSQGRNAPRPRRVINPMVHQSDRDRDQRSQRPDNSWGTKTSRSLHGGVTTPAICSAVGRGQRLGEGGRYDPFVKAFSQAPAVAPARKVKSKVRIANTSIGQIANITGRT